MEESLGIPSALHKYKQEVMEKTYQDIACQCGAFPLRISEPLGHSKTRDKFHKNLQTRAVRKKVTRIQEWRHQRKLVDQANHPTRKLWKG